MAKKTAKWTAKKAAHKGVAVDEKVRLTAKKAAHKGVASEKVLLLVLKRAGKKYLGASTIAWLIGGTSAVWVMATIRKLRATGHSIQSKRGIGGGYRIG